MFDVFVLYLKQSEATLSKEHWKTVMADANPTRFPGLSPFQLDNASRHELRLDLNISLPSKSGLTRPTILQAAWAILISHHTNNEDVVYGLTLTGRNAPISGIAKMLGPLVSVIPFRITSSRQLTVHEYLHQVQTSVANDTVHQEFGMQNIQRLSPEAKAACSFQNMLNINVKTEVEQENILKSLPRVNGPSSDFDTLPLVLDCYLHGCNAQLTVNFNKLAIHTLQTQRLLHQLRGLVLLLCNTNSSTKIGDLRFISHEDETDLIRVMKAPSSVPSTTLDFFDKEKESTIPFGNKPSASATPCSPHLELSVLQQDMICSMTARPDCYGVQTAWNVQSSSASLLNVQRLVNAWDVVVQRHSVLQTCLVKDEGIAYLQDNRVKPRVVVVPQSADPSAALLSLPPIDYLAVPTLHRLAICIGPDSKFLVMQLDICHVIVDDVSCSILLRDLKAAYSQAVHTHTTEVTSSFPHPADLGTASVRMPEAPKVDRYWTKYLSNLIPTSFPNHHMTRERTKHASKTFIFDTAVARQYACAASITVAVLLQSCRALVLRSYTSTVHGEDNDETQEEVCFGYLVSRRTSPAGDIDSKTFGCHIDMLIQRARIPFTAPVADLLQKVLEDYAAGTEHTPDSPLLSYHRHCVNDDGSRIRLFNTLINIYRVTDIIMDDPRGEGGGEEEEADKSKDELQLELIRGVDPWDFSVVVQVEEADEEGKTEVEFVYDTDALDETRATSLVQRFENVFGKICGSQQQGLLGLGLTNGDILAEVR